jgi:hypothetical protein
MSYFAYVPVIINSKGVVENVISAEQDFIDSGLVGDSAEWFQTSYNTRGNVHYGQDNKPDGGVALRGNYAGVGDIYDAVHDVFYVPKPQGDWVLDEQTWTWVQP